MSSAARRRKPRTIGDRPDLPAATSSGSGVRRLPAAVLLDLTHLARPIPSVAPPPMPTDARRPAVATADRVDFGALCAQYRPRAPQGTGDGYFPTVPGIPLLTSLPDDDERDGPRLDGARVAVLCAAAVLGALLALL